jgi:hypothetical protein
VHSPGRIGKVLEGTGALESDLGDGGQAC